MTKLTESDPTRWRRAANVSHAVSVLLTACAVVIMVAGGEDGLEMLTLSLVWMVLGTIERGVSVVLEALSDGRH